MDKDIAIEINNVSKQYYVGQVQRSSGYRTMRDVLTDAMKSPFQRVRNMVTGQAQSAANLTDSIWALKDVNFSVKKGEVIGIIGHNGAGKSTLLKILSRITDPTEGEIAYRGRLGALLEVGTGFHPELTGRENIYLNGAILGMKRSEITHQFDEIVAFAGVEQFVDTPVKHYSSGMYVRLAFAVAAHLEPEILIVDEVLSVGDAAFQKRSLGKMQDVAGSGRTVLFVSHNMTAIQHLCNRVVVLKNGQVVDDNIPSIAIKKYLEVGLSQSSGKLDERKNRDGTGDFKFTSIRFVERGTNNPIIQSGNDIDIHIRCTLKDRDYINNCHVALTFTDIYNNILFVLSTTFLNKPLRLDNNTEIVFQVDRLPLIAGQYSIKAWGAVQMETADRIEDAFKLEVQEGDFFNSGKTPNANRHGYISVPHLVKIREQSNSYEL